jgi:hypothetical protein
MKLICAALGVAALCAAGVSAQDQTFRDKSERKVEVKDGKKITVTGCLSRANDGQYVLTTDEGAFKYALVTDKDLAKDIGHQVLVHGKATDRGNAKVKIESKVGTAGTKDDKTKAELKGNLDVRYLGVDSVKSLTKSCL